MSKSETPSSSADIEKRELERVARVNYLRDLESHFDLIPGMSGIILPNPQKDGKLYILTPTYDENKNWTGVRLEPKMISDTGYEYMELSDDKVRIIQAQGGDLKGDETQEELLKVAQARIEEIMAPVRRAREQRNSHSILQ